MGAEDVANAPGHAKFSSITQTKKAAKNEPAERDGPPQAAPDAAGNPPVYGDGSARSDRC